MDGHTDQTTQAARIAAARLAGHLSTLGFGMVLIERDGRVIDMDDHALQLLGRTRADVAGIADVSTLLAPEERFKRMAYRQRRRQGGGAGARFRTIALRPDGRRVPIDAAILPLHGAGAAVVAIRDVSDLVARDQVIDWYAALVERMPIGVVILDVTGADRPEDITIWSANPAASRAADQPLDAVVGLTIGEVPGGSPVFADADRMLALRSNGRVEDLPDLVTGPPDVPGAVHRRTIVALPEGGVALLLDDITRERLDDLRHRRLAERIVQLSDRERRAIAMGIHDDPIQQIAAASLLVAQSRRKGAESRAEWLEDIENALRRATRSLRELVFELIPPELVESGLAAAVTSAADHLFADTPVHVRVDCDLVDEPPHPVQSTAFRIVAEALTNIRKHARARTVQVVLRAEGNELIVVVTDDGVGFRRSGEPGHIGLRTMYDRAAAVGGTASVTTAPGGTTVSARLPLDGAGAAPAPDAPEPVRFDLALRDTVAEGLRREIDGLREAHSRATAGADHERRRLAAIVAVSEGVRAGDGRDDRLERAVRTIADTVRDGCAIRLLDDAGAVLERVASWHAVPEQLEHLDRWIFADRAIGTSHATVVVATGEPLLIDTERVQWRASDGTIPPPAPIEPHTAIIAPLRQASTVIGTLTVVRDLTGRRLTVDDLGWIGSIADVVAAGITRTT